MRTFPTGLRGSVGQISIAFGVLTPPSVERQKAINSSGVAVAPGVAFGEHGEGYVRIGLVENEHRIRQAARNVKKLLDQAGQHLSAAREKEEAAR